MHIVKQAGPSVGLNIALNLPYIVGDSLLPGLYPIPISAGSVSLFYLVKLDNEDLLRAVFCWQGCCEIPFISKAKNLDETDGEKK